MLNKDGGVQADVTVSVLEDEPSLGALSPSSEGKTSLIALYPDCDEDDWCAALKCEIF